MAAAAPNRQPRILTQSDGRNRRRRYLSCVRGGGKTMVARRRRTAGMMAWRPADGSWDTPAQWRRGLTRRAVQSFATALPFLLALGICRCAEGPPNRRSAPKGSGYRLRSVDLGISLACDQGVSTARDGSVSPRSCIGVSRRGGSTRNRRLRKPTRPSLGNAEPDRRRRFRLDLTAGITLTTRGFDLKVAQLRAVSNGAQPHAL